MTDDLTRADTNGSFVGFRREFAQRYPARRDDRVDSSMRRLLTLLPDSDQAASVRFNSAFCVARISSTSACVKPME